jgi:hypothetical protein
LAVEATHTSIVAPMITVQSRGKATDTGAATVIYGRKKDPIIKPFAAHERGTR